jgi:biopolymer transport protein ExbD
MSVRLDHGKADLDEVHEINVTPFIDVMLVLLIIFMVAAPLATVAISVNLPTLSVQQEAPDKLVLTVKSQDADIRSCAVNPALTLTLGESIVSREALGDALTRASNGNRETPVSLRADKAVPYGEVLEVMNLLRAAGFLKVALVGLEKGR